VSLHELEYLETDSWQYLISGHDSIDVVWFRSVAHCYTNIVGFTAAVGFIFRSVLWKTGAFDTAYSKPVNKCWWHTDATLCDFWMVGGNYFGAFQLFSVCVCVCVCVCVWGAGGMGYRFFFCHVQFLMKNNGQKHFSCLIIFRVICAQYRWANILRLLINFYCIYLLAGK
jgi:hypothetical protein